MVHRKDGLIATARGTRVRGLTGQYPERPPSDSAFSEPGERAEEEKAEEGSRDRSERQEERTVIGTWQAGNHE